MGLNPCIGGLQIKPSGPGHAGKFRVCEQRPGVGGGVLHEAPASRASALKQLSDEQLQGFLVTLFEPRPGIELDDTRPILGDRTSRHHRSDDRGSNRCRGASVDQGGHRKRKSPEEVIHGRTPGPPLELTERRGHQLRSGVERRPGQARTAPNDSTTARRETR